MELILSLVVLSVTVVTAILLHHILPFWLDRKYNNSEKLYEETGELKRENKVLQSKLSSVAYHIATNNQQEAAKILEQYRK